MKLSHLAGVLISAVCLTGPALAGPRAVFYALPDLSMGQVSFPGGKTLDVSLGIGSSAYHRPSDAPDVFYAMSDRGPNIKCKSAKETTGLDVNVMCQGDKKSKIFPMPDFQPVIVKLKLKDGKAEIVETIKLKGASGKPMTGLTNGLTVTTTEKSYSNTGKLLPFTPNGLDTEALVRLKDGTFWIGEEYGASLAHVSADGRVLERLVPKGLQADLAGADYEVKGVLPAIIMKRKLNRGIESLAVSPDEKYLYFAMQSPLANPDVKAYKSSANVRLFKFDREKGQVVGEWLYVLDAPETFIKDNLKKKRKPKHVKVSEMVALGPDKLLVLERISRTTKFYAIDLSKARKVPAMFDDPAHRPTLANTKPQDFQALGLEPLRKHLVLNTDVFAKAPGKIESIALLNDHEMVLLNDNDFGLWGATTKVMKVSFDKPIAQIAGF